MWDPRGPSPDLLGLVTGTQWQDVKKARAMVNSPHYLLKVDFRFVLLGRSADKMMIVWIISCMYFVHIYLSTSRQKCPFETSRVQHNQTVLLQHTVEWLFAFHWVHLAWHTKLNDHTLSVHVLLSRLVLDRERDFEKWFYRFQYSDKELPFT